MSAIGVLNGVRSARWQRLQWAGWAALMLATLVILILGLAVLHFGWARPCAVVLPQDRLSCEVWERQSAQARLPWAFWSFYFPLGAALETMPWILVTVLSW